MQLSLMLVLISPCFPNACPEATSGILYELFGSNTYFFWHQENDFGKLEDEVFFFFGFHDRNWHTVQSIPMQYNA